MALYEPFGNDYLGLSELVSKLCCDDRTDDCGSESYRGVTTNDFWSNGRGSDTTTREGFVATGFLPIPLPLEKVTELSKVMRERRQRSSSGGAIGAGRRGRDIGWCVFCKNNGESELLYQSHRLKSPAGKTTCPVLRAYTCPLCGQNGDDAHTIKYCPTNANQQPAKTTAGRYGHAIGTTGVRSSSPTSSRERTHSVCSSNGTSSSGEASPGFAIGNAGFFRWGLAMEHTAPELQS